MAYTALVYQPMLELLDRGLDHATDAGLIVVDMKRDWQRVFPGPD